MQEEESHPHAVFAQNNAANPGKELLTGAAAAVAGAAAAAHRGSALELLLQKKAEKKGGGVAPVHLVQGSQV